MASFGTTAKWALRYLLGGSNVNEIDDGFLALATDLDSKLTPYDEGLLTDRPISTVGTPGKKGRTYRATDDTSGGANGTLHVDYGTGWIALSPAGIGAQLLDADLTAIAALATQPFGLSLLTQASAAAARSTLGAMAATDGENAFSTYKTLKRFSASLAQGTNLTAAGVILGENNSTVLTSAMTVANAFYLDPADYTAGSRSTYIRVKARLDYNSTAPGQTIAVAVVPVVATRTGATVTYTPTTGSPISRNIDSTAAASSSRVIVGADSGFSAGLFAVFVQASTGSPAAGSKVDVFVDVQMRQV